MFLKSISLTNILSFGDKTTHIELKPLNILIGHNGSGKSNLIECISILSSAPYNLPKAFSDGGGISHYLWKGIAGDTIDAILETITPYEIIDGSVDIKYRLVFTEIGQRFALLEESIENKTQDYYFLNSEGDAIIRSKGKVSRISNRAGLNLNSPIISQLRDPSSYPEITWLGDAFRKIRIYRNWTFGQYSPPRLPQKADMPNDFPMEDCSNLGLVLNSIKTNSEARRKLLKHLRDLYPNIEDFDVTIYANTVQVVLHEENFSIPATRLSDGTLRYLCLLAILCHPEPPPLICIEEPELGLHPDMIHVIADLLRDAATRTQLIVTTHSDLLVEEFTNEPECILTFEKRGDQSEVRRLDSEELSHWLEKYSLGQLRQQGHLAGNRW